MTQFDVSTNFQNESNRLKTRFQILEPEEPGYSGFESGNSRFTRILRIFFLILRTWNCISHVLAFFLFPNIIKHYSLSPVLPLTLSRVLSLFLVLSLTPNPRDPKPSLYPWSKAKRASIGWWIISPACSFPGRLEFKLLVQGRARPKVNKLGFGKSLVLGGLNRFPPISHLPMNHSTRV